MSRPHSKLHGITRMQITHEAGSTTKINLELVASPEYNAQPMVDARNWDDLFPGDVIIPCPYCGTHGAKKTKCRQCNGEVA